MTETLTAWLDVKSPYAYLAIEPTRRLARRAGVTLDWLPYELDLGGFMGRARVDDAGEVIEQDRSAHQWRRVKYSYMDARRIANLRGMTIRGTQKIWDTSTASIAMLWARERGRVEAWLDAVFPPFWRRELDIEDSEVVARVLEEAGCETAGFADWLAGPGRALHDNLRAEAEELGVFGVPWYQWRGEGFWGREALPLLAQRITGVVPDWAADVGLTADDGD